MDWKKVVEPKDGLYAWPEYIGGLSGNYLFIYKNGVSLNYDAMILNEDGIVVRDKITFPISPEHASSDKESFFLAGAGVLDEYEKCLAILYNKELASVSYIKAEGNTGASLPIAGDKNIFYILIYTPYGDHAKAGKNIGMVAVNGSGEAIWTKSIPDTENSYVRTAVQMEDSFLVVASTSEDSFDLYRVTLAGDFSEKITVSTRNATGGHFAPSSNALVVDDSMLLIGGTETNSSALMVCRIDTKTKSISYVALPQGSGFSQLERLKTGEFVVLSNKKLTLLDPEFVPVGIFEAGAKENVSFDGFFPSKDGGILLTGAEGEALHSKPWIAKLPRSAFIPIK